MKPINPAPDDISREITDGHFRIALFGSARTAPGTKLYKDIHELAKLIGAHGFDIVTGGGPGLMEAANSGHAIGRSKKNGSHSIGLTITLPMEVPQSKHLDIKQHFERFSERLDNFMLLSQMVVVTSGGVGTFLEFLYSWQLTQVKHICSMPIILYGEMWADFLKWVEQYPLKDGFISPQDMSNILLAKTKEEVIAKIEQFYEVFQKEGENYCLNYKLYKIR